MSRARQFIHRLAPRWLASELRIRTTYRRMRREEVWGFSFAPFDEHRCMFIHIPKGAGVSVARALFGNMGGGHVPLRTLRRVFGDQAVQEYYKFTFVRNPFDRLVSAFFFLKGGGMDDEDRRFAATELAPYEHFDEFVHGWVTPSNVRRGLHFIPQVEWIRLDDEPIGVDFLGRFEQLPEDFAAVCEHLGIDARLEHHNATKGRKDYRSYYDEDTRRLVADVYAEDLAVLGYDFDGLVAKGSASGREVQ